MLLECVALIRYFTTPDQVDVSLELKISNPTLGRRMSRNNQWEGADRGKHMLSPTFLVCPQPGFHQYSLHPLFVFRCKTKHKPRQPADDADRLPFVYFLPQSGLMCEYLRDLVSVKLPAWYKYYHKQEVHGLESWTRLMCIWRIILVETILMSVVCGPCFLKLVETTWSSIARPAALEDNLVLRLSQQVFLLYIYIITPEHRRT